jgi:uroporphyrinogen-III decarboxylase
MLPKRLVQTEYFSSTNHLTRSLKQTYQADMICIDWSVDMAQARKILGNKPVSGNVDPLVLLGPEDKVR